MENDSVFQGMYKKLTPTQRQAVDTVEGPVVVLAGPGTGKTHILTLRIANILRVTQASPDSILALTFTDSAVRTMQKRLTALVGEKTARQVTIATFHGFAELVRAEYPEVFTDDADKRLMGDVEKTLLLREAIDTAEIDQLRPAKMPYTYLRDILSFYDELMREGGTLSSYRAWGEKTVRALTADESLQYKKGAKVGELTKAGQEKVSRLARVEEVARILEQYQQLKDTRGLMDFSDVLIGVINHIKDDEGLQSDLQERYQYILADEHQDANATQHNLLNLFAYDDHPNIFIVGDEKQAIYRFQGAEVGAFKSFTDIFPLSVVIRLSASFRSYQHILDTAHEIANETENHPRLTAVRGDNGESVSIVTAEDPLDERAHAVTIIEGLINDGVLPHEIAIIARKNITADLFADALSAQGLPVLRAGDLSLTARPIMRALMSLMGYVANPMQFADLRVALLAPWWSLPTADLLMLLHKTSDSELLNALASKYPDTARVLASCVDRALVQTPIACFSYVFAESGARDYLLSHENHLDDIALVRTLMMYLESVVLLTETTSFAEAFSSLSKAREHRLSPVKVSVTEREGFVTVITAHKAKGMEFRYVFIPDCTENTWEKGGVASKIPSPFETNSKQTYDDVRRLFYVALTRAKDHTYISYAKTSAEGRERLLTSIVPMGLSETKVVSEVLPLLHSTINAPRKIQTLIEFHLENKGLSPSAVNEYMESPATFFARRVLRIHEPPTPALIYGSAMHAALAAALSSVEVDEVHMTLERVFLRSLLPRDSAFEKLRSEAHNALKAVLPELATLGTPVHIEKTFSMARDIDGVAVELSGKIDATFKQGNKLFVADFKTGSSVSAKNETYVRQLALYAAMLGANGEIIDGGLLLGVSEKGIKQVPVSVGITEQETALVDMDTVVRELRSGVWRRGATSDYDALLKLMEC